MAPFSLLLASLIAVSCGTVHQMLPPAPLATNEFRGSLVISYDLNRLSPIPSCGLNFYWGAGKDYNLGFGYQPPFGISHVTAVKYLNPRETSSRELFASLNGLLLSMDYSPNLELGGGYLRHEGKSCHRISGGAWIFIDKDAAEPLWRILAWRSTAPAHISPIARPFIRYEYSRDDFELSLRNNAGLTRQVIAWERRKLDERKGIVLPDTDIVYLVFNPLSDKIQIQMKDSTTYKISRTFPLFDAIVRGAEIDKYRLERFTRRDSIGYYYVVKMVPDRRTNGNRIISEGNLYELSFDRTWLDYADKKGVVISPFPERTAGILGRINWLVHDWSIAAGTRLGRQ